MYKERKKGLEKRFIPRWVRVDEGSHHSLPAAGKTWQEGLASGLGRAKDASIDYNSEVGRHWSQCALMEEVRRICRFMQLPARSLKGCRRLLVLQPPTKIYQRQQQRVSTGVQAVIARFVEYEASIFDVVVL